MVWIWLSIVLLLIFIEVMTVGLTTVWFVISGIAAMILSLFIDSVEIEFAVFVLGGVLLLITTRPYLVKKLKVKEAKTNLDRVIGMKGTVTDEIDLLKPGEVKVDNKKWTAIADNKINVGKTVEVLEIIGVKIKVKEID